MNRKFNRKDEHVAMIIILTKIYNNEFIDFKDKKNMSYKILKQFQNFEDLDEYNMKTMFYSVVKQLKDLNFIKYDDYSKIDCSFSNANITGQGGIILDKVFFNESLSKFLTNENKKTLSDIIINEISNNSISLVVDIFVKTLSETCKNIYDNLN